MKTLAGFLFLALAAGDALAWRCNGWLVEPGQSQYEIGERCGDPQSAERRIEWRVQTTFQQQCQSIPEPVYQPPGPSKHHGQGRPPAPQPSVTYRTVCTAVPVSFSVPVDVEIWYFDDVSVPKALHFENGRLVWIEPLWRLRHN
jgi:hypothetical protein